jgi:lysophospholipase L1-like esterase
MSRYIILGDSIAYGNNDPYGGWVWYLRELLSSNNPDNEIVNLSIGGETILNFSKDIESGLKRFLDATIEIVFILALGINDTNSIKHPAATSDNNEFINSLGKILDYLKKYSSFIYCVGLTRVDESKVSPDFTNSKIEEYDKLLEIFAGENRISYIDLKSSVFNKDFGSLLDDGLHPNTIGHKLIYEEIRKHIK